MGMEQETLIYVEENDREEAKILTKGLLDKNVRDRAYINALGAELGMKYLALENINSSKTYNMHNVHKILEEFDISDIMLTNVHLDVRVVFDENQIFIPKSHFEYDILPDAYLVFVLAKDNSHVKFAGFFEPKLINKNNHNADYYFIEKEKLTSPVNLKAFVESFKGNTTQSLSDNDNETAQMLMLSLVDQNASKNEVKELMKYLTKSSYLRDKFIEFENFEILSYKAERCSEIILPQQLNENDEIDVTADDINPLAIENSDEFSVAESTFEEAEESALDENLTQNDELNLAVEGLEAPSEDLIEGLSEESIVEDSVNDDLVSEMSEVSEENNENVLADTVGEFAEAVVEGSLEGLSAGVGEAVSEAIAAAEVVPEIAENIMGLAETINTDSLPELNEVSQDSLLKEDESVAISEDSHVEDVTDMFTNNSLPQMGEASVESEESLLPEMSETEEPALNMETFAPLNNTGFEEVSSSMPEMDLSLIDEPVAPKESDSDMISFSDARVNDFEESNADDFFSEMDNATVQEDDSISFEAIHAAKPSEALQNLNNMEEMASLDFSTVEPHALPRQDDMPSENEMEVLDISNVNAVPNDNDKNISETIEFNNIELSHEPPCENQINGENTEPVADMNNFAPLEPVEQVSDNGTFNMESLTLAGDMSAMPPLAEAEEQVQPVAEAPKPAQPEGFVFEPLEGFGEIDMESLSVKPQMQPAPAKNNLLNEEEIAKIDAELDGIPDLDSFNEDLNIDEPSMTAESSNIVDESVQDVQSQPQIEDELPSQEALDSFSEDDIVESVAEEKSVEENVSSDDEDVVVNTESLDVENVSEEGDVLSEENAEIHQEAVEAESATEEEEIAEAAAEEEDLTMLFAESGDEAAELPPDLSTLDEIPNVQSGPKFNMPVKTVAIAAVAAVLAIGGIGGFLMKNKNSAIDSEPLAQTVPENIEPAIPVEDNSDILAGNPVSSEDADKKLAANMPEVQTLPAPQQEPVNVKTDKKEEPAAKAASPINPAGTLMSVKKLSWQVPDYLSYSQQIQKYLQTAGKSIKLTLSGDLLLVNEFAYSNNVKVDLKLSSDGTLKDSKIVNSSGSKQIDQLVLQTVKETLNVVKPPAGEVPTAEFNLALIINF